MKYIAIYTQETDGGYSVVVPDLSAVSQGDTLPEAKENIQSAVAEVIESMVEDGQAVPPPSTIVDDVTVEVA